MTGVVVNEKLNLPRRFVRNIRAMIHICEQGGTAKSDAALQADYDPKQRRGTSPSLLAHLQGKIDYLGMIGGTNDAGIGGLLVTNLSDAEWLRALCRLVALLSLIGLLRLARRTSALQYFVFALCYMLMLLVWHFPPNERFLVPIFPILLAGLAEELGFHAGLVKRSFRSPDIALRAVAVLLATLFAGLCVTALGTGAEVYHSYLPRFFRSEQAQFREDRRLCAWISANTPDDATFLAFRDTRIGEWTGRRAIRLIVPPALYYDGDKAETDRYFRSLVDFARRYGITYIVVSDTDGYSLDIPDTGFAIVRQLTSDEKRFQVQFRSPLVALYKIGNE